MTTRTDVHRPSFADPSEYVEVGDGDLHPDEGYTWLDPDLAPERWFDGNMTRRGRCDHCGAGPLRYVVFFKHLPTDVGVTVGVACAHKLSLSSKSEYQRERDRKERHRVAKRDAWRKMDESHERVYQYLYERVNEKLDYGHGGFFHDLLHKLNRYGELTEKQTAAVLRAMDRDREKAEQRQAEADAAEGPLVEGRREVVGEVLGTKVQDGFYGDALKMLVREDDGNKVWGTVPQALLDQVYEMDKDDDDFDGTKKLLPGKRVRFTALVLRSDRDEHFGFFKRPTKAEVVT